MSATTLNTLVHSNGKNDVRATFHTIVTKFHPAALFRSAVNEMRLRRQIAHLSALPDYLLDDQGISRADIVLTVRGAKNRAGV